MAPLSTQDSALSTSSQHSLEAAELRRYLDSLWQASPAGVIEELSPFHEPAPLHLQVISDAIVAAVTGRGSPNVMVMLPPRHGKSFLCSHWTPVWFLNRFPERRVMLASYEATFAETWGRKVRNSLVEHAGRLQVRVAEDSSAVAQWYTTAGGGMNAVGVAGPFTGFGAHLLIIDDPLKNMEEASSEVIRQKQWEWVLSTAFARREPGNVTLLVMTRWHPDDLVGRLEQTELAGGDSWRRIVLPLLAGPDDPLGRQPGAPLWPARYDAAACAAIQANVLAADGRHIWDALYQQQPSTATAGTFKREWVRRYQTVPPDLPRVTAVDLGVETKQTSDRTAIVTLAVASPSELYVVDVLAGRWDEGERRRAFEQAVVTHQPRAFLIEKVAFQSDLIQRLRRETTWPIREAIPDQAKHLRAAPVATAFERGELYLPEQASWLDDFERELFAFPRGKHDDCVDALVFAWRQARLYETPGALGGVPAVPPVPTGWRPQFVQFKSHRDQRPRSAVGWR